MQERSVRDCLCNLIYPPEVMDIEEFRSALESGDSALDYENFGDVVMYTLTTPVLVLGSHLFAYRTLCREYVPDSSTGDAVAMSTLAALKFRWDMPNLHYTDLPIYPRQAA